MTSPPQDDFISVTHKRTPKKRKGHKPRERTLLERVESRRTALKESGYPARCRELLRTALDGPPESRCPPPVCAVCLGLGSVAESSKSQDQFVLLQELLSELGSLADGAPTIYDPVNSPEDLSFFSSAGFQVLDSEHRLEFDKVTFLYMPHCPRSLFEELLRKNWAPDKLTRLVLVGNRLDSYYDPTHPSASAAAKTPFIAKSLPLWTMVPIPEDARFLEAFNDLAFQWIPPSRLEGFADFATAPGADESSEGLVEALEKIKI